MNIRSFILLMALLCIASDAVRSQNVEWSNQQKLKSKNNYTRIIGENEAGYFLLRGKDNKLSRELMIEKYKNNLALDNSRDLWQPPSSQVEEVLLQPTGMLVFGAARNSSIDKVDLFYWRVDNNLASQNTVQSILQADESVIKGNTGFFIRQSADRSKIAVLYAVQSDRQPASVFANVYNSDFTLQFTGKLELTCDISDLFITAVECDNSGTLYALMDYPDKSKSQAADNRDFSLYQFSSAQTAPIKFELNNDSVEIFDLGMALNSYDKNITVSGFYRKPSKETRTDGVFACVIDMATALVRIKKFTHFDKPYNNKINSLISNETSPGLNDLALRKVIPRSDGGCIVIAEKAYESKQTYTYYVNGFPQTSSRTLYNFDEIFVIALAPDGSLQYNQVVKKRQSSINDGGYYSSFVVLNTNSALAFIYSLDATSESDIMVTSIAPDGFMDTRILIKAMSYYVSLMPPESRQVSANTTLICALKDRKFTVMKVTY